MKKGLTRRKFVRLAAAGAGTLCLLPGCSGEERRWRFFTGEEASLVDAVADQIIPPDEWPGGKESGVTNFIDKQLAGNYKRFQETYRRGLKAIQESCYSEHGNKFEELSREEQTKFLENMESGKMIESVWQRGFDIEFFNLLRDHAMQSYYGSPIHGGNRDKLSYKMIGLDYPLIIGQNRYNS
jgi:gluconate 2-dehydrogenase gamma chain